MRRQIALEHKLHGLDGLSNVVGAMKSLAAHHLRNSKQGLTSARSYRRVVEGIVEAAGVDLPPPGNRGRLLIVIGGDIGLCGSYNSRLAALAHACRLEEPSGPTYCIGRRVARPLERQGVSVAATYPAPTSVAGITDVLLHVADEVFSAYLQQRLSEITIVAAEFEGIGQFHPRRVPLLPIRLELKSGEHATPPRYVSQHYFSHVAIRELLYIVLYEQLLEALASEHGSRLVACQGAEKWLDSKRERIERLLRRMRRESSTQETLEIATNARLIRADLHEAVAPEKPAEHRQPPVPPLPSVT